MSSVSEYVAATLRAWRVDRVYGLPGHGVDPLVGALSGGAHAPEFVQARHEESAALMACADAKLTGRVGCCVASSGSGVLRLVSGLYDAALDRQPVLALIGETTGPAPGRRRAVSPSDTIAQVCEYTESVSDPALVADALDRAVRAALTGRGAAALVLTRAVLEAAAPAGARDTGRTAKTPVHFSPFVRSPERAEVERAAEVLNAGRRVAVVVGPDGSGAARQIVRLADRLGAGIARTPLGRDIVPDDVPGVAGVAAPFGGEPAHALLDGCDTLLLVGAHDLETGLIRPHEPPCMVSVDRNVDACPVGGLPSLTARLAGDVPRILDDLDPLLRDTEDRTWRTDVEQAVGNWRQTGRAKAYRFYGMAVNPRSVVAELSARLPERAVVVSDCGTALDWWTRHLELREGMCSTLSAGLRAPGAAVPYALAARLAFPDRPVIALVGDGALQTGGMNELITIRRHLERLAGSPPTVLCVLNNEDSSRLTWERRSRERDPRIPATGEVPAVSFTGFAELVGLPAVRCRRPGEVAAAWDRALGGSGPTLLEFMVDGDTPPDWADPERPQGARPPSLHRVTGNSWRRRVAASLDELFGSG
ncbi:thiamine pyrophosphate-binding protein [Streptomyces sp. NPDC057363]|uniref:thiamine pyrophosphate-binding protein n=1 Tax=Streptomyces sp. NPDC057363 TaxID=3346107 RepID=UPI00363778C1